MALIKHDVFGWPQRSMAANLSGSRLRYSTLVFLSERRAARKDGTLQGERAEWRP